MGQVSTLTICHACEAKRMKGRRSIREGGRNERGGLKIRKETL